MNRLIWCVLPALVVSLPIHVFSQAETFPDSIRGTAGVSVADSLNARRIAPVRQDSTAQTDTIRHVSRTTKSPGLALLLSAVVPGAGQLYNGAYWKVPIVFGFAVYFGAVWIDQNKKYHDFRDQYAASVASGNPDPRLLNTREFYREQRDTFAWYMFILYVLNVVDAYVDASLHDFDVSGDLSLRMMPEAALRPGAAMVRFQLTF